MSQETSLSLFILEPVAGEQYNGTLFSLGRQGGHHELAERLVEIQYELTDRLAFYLCGRKPGE